MNCPSLGEITANCKSKQSTDYAQRGCYVLDLSEYVAPKPVSYIEFKRVCGSLTYTDKMPGGSFSLPAIVTCPIGAKLAGVPGTPCENCYALKGRYQMPNVRNAQALRYTFVKRAIASTTYRDKWVSTFAGYLNGQLIKARARVAKLGKPEKHSMSLYHAALAAKFRCGAGGLRILKGGAPIKETPEQRELGLSAIQAKQTFDALLPIEKKRVKAALAYDKAKYFRWHDAGDVFSYGYMVLLMDVVKATPDLQHWLPTQERATVKRWIKEHGPLPLNLTVRISSPRVDVHPMPKTSDNVLASSVSSTGETPGAVCPAYTRGGICGDCRSCWHNEKPLITYPVH
jgi:hypothetical protein